MSVSQRVAAAALALLMALPAAARDTPEQGADVSPPASSHAREKAQGVGHLLGTWGGLRTRLIDAGVTPSVGYKIESAWNPRGGTRRKATAVGQLDLGLLLDTGTLLGDEGGSVQLTVTKRHGPSLNTLAGLDLLQEPQETYGRNQTWRTTELWYMHRNRADTVIWRIGRIVGGDFNDWGCDFTSLGLCGSRAGTTTADYLWYNFPIAEWGGWVKVRNDRAFAHVGVTEDNPQNLDPDFFVAKFKGAKGAFFHFEGGWTPDFGGGRVGAYQVGGWYVTSARPDTYFDAARRPLALTGQPGVNRYGQRGYYVQAMQQVTGGGRVDPVTNLLHPARGLTLGLNYVHNDHRTATIIDDVAVQAQITAPFPGRGFDQVGVAIGRSSYAKRAAGTSFLLDPQRGRRRNETRMEAYYRALVLPGVFARPFAQYVVDPGAYRTSRNAVILGVRADLVL